MKRTSLICLLALAPVVASANIIPTGTSITGSGPFTWTYSLQLSEDQDVQSGLAPSGNPVPHTNLSFGSFLTLYDFDGYIAGSCTGPAGWSCSIQDTGYTPDDVQPNDNPSIANLTWVYTTGATQSGQPGGLDLGLFSADSTYGISSPVSYSSRGIKNNGASAGTIADNVGTTQGPVALSVPEPGSLALAGLALVMLRRFMRGTAV
jgi:PEP-CTERM motif